MGEPESGHVGGAEGLKPAQYYPPCTRRELVVAPMLGWNHAGTLLSYALNARNILEYGSGGSTLWLAMLCPKARMVSIEHNMEWVVLVRTAMSRMANAGIVLSPRVSVQYAAFIAYSGERAYVHEPEVDRYKPYDLIFVDGAHTTRTPCLKAAADLLMPGGVVILDNSEESAYQEGKAFLLAQPGMILIEETEDSTWDPNRSRRKMWIAQKA